MDSSTPARPFNRQVAFGSSVDNRGAKRRLRYSPQYMRPQKQFTWSSSSRTDVGIVRNLNEDACLEQPDIGLWVVADGMGGHTAGDVASRMIVDTMAAVHAPSTLSGFVQEVEEHLLGINARLREIALRRQTQTIGSTVAALLALGQHGVCVWAGDSRIYRFRDGGLEKVTQDHALVQELVGQGILTQEEAANHPQANLVTRAVGATDTLLLDMEIVAFRHEDVFVLCTDGLDKEVKEKEIAEIIERETAKGSGSQVSNVLVDLALSRGARDNVTAVTVRIAEEGAEQTVLPNEDPQATDSDVTIPRIRSGSPIPRS